MSETKTNSEKFDILIEAVLEEMITRNFPGGLSFDIPGTDNEAILQVIPDALDKKNFRFRIGVHRNGYDMLVSNFWEKGSEEGLRQYFTKAAKDEEEKKRIRAALEELSASVDDKMD